MLRSQNETLAVVMAVCAFHEVFTPAFDIRTCYTSVSQWYDVMLQSSKRNEIYSHVLHYTRLIFELMASPDPVLTNEEFEEFVQAL